MHLADKVILDLLPDFRIYFEKEHDISSINFERLFKENWKIFISGHEDMMECIPWLQAHDRLEKSEWFLVPISQVREREVDKESKFNNFLYLDKGNIEYDLDDILFDDCKIFCPLHGKYFLITYFYDVCIYVIVESPGRGNSSEEISRHLRDVRHLPHRKDEVMKVWDSRD